MTPEEIKIIRKKLGVTQLELSVMIGSKKSIISKWEQGSNPIPESKIILLNKLVDSKNDDHINEPNLEYITKKDGEVPFYDMYTNEGDKNGAHMGDLYPSSMINLGDVLGDSQSALRVYGNSMLPEYPAGCVVGLKESLDGVIHNGQVYVIETIDNKYIKRIIQENEVIICYSDNEAIGTHGPRKGSPLFPPFTIPLKQVKKLHRVVGVIKRTENG